MGLHDLEEPGPAQLGELGLVRVGDQCRDECIPPDFPGSSGRLPHQVRVPRASPRGGRAVPMQYAVNKAAIDRAIDTMIPVDPVSYKPALTAAYNALQHTYAEIKHIILLGDSDAEDSYTALATQIHKPGITIWTVVTEGGTYGFGAAYGTMQNIARWGGGRSAQAEATLCCHVRRPASMSSWQRRGRQRQPLHHRC